MGAIARKAARVTPELPAPLSPLEERIAALLADAVVREIRGAGQRT
jgi:hypothetical protein